MKKYFVTSDIHSFFSQLRRALESSGFDINNKNHILVICGDIFDRGNQSKDLIDWLLSIPEDQLILIQGNHELLYQELIKKDKPDRHDYSNGTVKTFCHLAGYKESDMDPYEYMFRNNLYGNDVTPDIIEKHLAKTWKAIVKEVTYHPATELINSNRFINYLELDRFIFVHSFIPVQLKAEHAIGELKYYPTYHFNPEYLEYIPEWRDAKALQWEDAKWGCPWRQFDAGLFDAEAKNGKILVCGHWHARAFHENYNNDRSGNNEIYVGDNLIALDSCIPVSGFCNVLVIDMQQRKLFDQHRDELRSF